MPADVDGGRDGPAVQADLRAVIERAKDARAVLGLAPTAPVSQARAAFHALCKKYHPARFARSSPETVRLANEAFLAIKRAYDGLIRPEPAKPEAAPRPTIDPPSGRFVRPTVPLPGGPTPTPSPSPAATVVKSSDKATVRMTPLRPPAETPTPTPTPAPTQRLPATPRPTDKQPAAPRATEKLPAPAKTPTPTPTPMPTPVPAAAPQPRSAERGEDQRFAAALDLLRRRLWRDAEKLLGELAVSVPADRRYRAYRHYARGRIAQDEGRLDEARAEWERALRLDPDLTAARVAIDQLPEPPKPSGGLFSKLFKRS